MANLRVASIAVCTMECNGRWGGDLTVRFGQVTPTYLSGISFGGVAGLVIDAWADGSLELVLSPEILDEYRREDPSFVDAVPSEQPR